MHRRTETRLIKIKSYRVFLMSLPWAWPSSENWTSHCFMKAFFFAHYFMNNVTMQDYTQDHSLTQDARGSPKRWAAQSLLSWRRVPIYWYTKGKPQRAKNRQNQTRGCPQSLHSAACEALEQDRKGAFHFRAEVSDSLMNQQWQKEEILSCVWPIFLD